VTKVHTLCFSILVLLFLSSSPLPPFLLFPLSLSLFAHHNFGEFGEANDRFSEKKPIFTIKRNIQMETTSSGMVIEGWRDAWMDGLDRPCDTLEI
jgi:hypothetical protein